MTLSKETKGKNLIILELSDTRTNDLTVTDTELSWKQNGETMTVPVDDIIGVTEAIPASDRVSDKSLTFDVLYAQHQGHNIKRAARLRIFGLRVLAQPWVDEIKNRINKVTTRPRRLLVLINPVGGKHNGVQVYGEVVAPLFAVAGITTDVIVSERKKHIVDVMLTYNIADVDGIVICGGDGTYQECMNPLVHRIQKDCGVDVNDPRAVLAPVPIPIGAIPTGTYCALAGACAGCRDVETAVLNIIRGVTRKHNIFAVFADSKLQGYSGILTGYGFLSDLCFCAEDMRYLGSMRYLGALFKLLFRRQRVYHAEIDFISRRKQTPEEDDTAYTKRSIEADEAHEVVQMELCDILALALKSDLKHTSEEEFDKARNTLIILYTPCSNAKIIKQFLSMSFTDEQMRESNNKGFNPESLSFLKSKQICGLKLKLVKESAKADENKLEHIIILDGELVKLNTPAFELGLHDGYISLYGEAPPY